MTLKLNRTTDSGIMTQLAREILERVFSGLKPAVSQYPTGIQIGAFFIRPEEKGLRFEILIEVERDSSPDSEPDTNPDIFLEYMDSAYSLHEAITRALVLHLEPRIEITALDLIASESKKAS